MCFPTFRAICLVLDQREDSRVLAETWEAEYSSALNDIQYLSIRTVIYFCGHFMHVQQTLTTYVYMQYTPVDHLLY